MSLVSHKQCLVLINKQTNLSKMRHFLAIHAAPFRPIKILLLVMPGFNGRSVCRVQVSQCDALAPRPGGPGGMFEHLFIGPALCLVCESLIELKRRRVVICTVCVVSVNTLLLTCHVTTCGMEEIVITKAHAQQ